MFDCGDGTVRQLLKSRMKPKDLKAIFITHLHGDHIYGLPALGMTMQSLFPAGEECPIYSTQGLLDIFRGAFS